MNKQDISLLIRFNGWANGRLLTTCQSLPPDLFTRPVTPDPGWGSLRGILVHALDAEMGWRAVLQELVEDNILQETDFPDVAALQTRWEVEQTAWLDYAAGLSDEQLQQRVGQDPTAGLTVWQTIMHVLMHSMQHRSEAALILTGYGRSPGALDFDLFLSET